MVRCEFSCPEVGARIACSYGRIGHLAAEAVRAYPRGVDEEQGIYRGEVLAIMGALADISSDTLEILTILGGEDHDGEEEMDS
jgi:hypothetical protein